MNVNFTSSVRNLIVSVTGELDQHNASYLREQTDLKITHSNIKNLVFDFTNLDFMDSSGIGLVMGRYKNLKKSGATLNLTNLPSNIYKVMKLAGIEKLAKIDKGAK